MITFFVIIGMISLAVAMHPFISYPLSLRFLPDRKQGAEAWSGTINADAKREHSFAICMCAYNEERVIEAKMRNLLALREREPGLEILVYVDNASDRTAELLSPYADRITLHVATERHGKTHGMNLLVANASASIIVFTDANVMLDMEVLDRLRPYFADPQTGCVCGNLIYTNADESITAASGSLYWRLEEYIKRQEQRSGSIMGADGSLYAIRRSLHRQPPDHIIDDMYVSFMILCEGYRILQATDVRAYEESASNSQEEFRRKVRIACQAFNVHRLIWPHLRKLDALTLYKYLSHKLVRWFTIYFLVASGLSFGIALALAGWYWAALTFVLSAPLALYVGARWSVPALSRISDIVLALAGVGIGVWRSIRGDLFQTWTPATSARNSAQG
ncbi:MAG TPA: glycosyltransferase [Rhodocyclaceae bacterium]|nr:glycosyltransferase [Rhodocyclaceae bacterium]